MPNPTTWWQWVALLVGGGGLVKALDVLVRYALRSQKQEDASARELRTELWERVETLERRVQDLQDEKDHWQKLYAETKSQNALLKQEIEGLKAQNETLRDLKKALERENEHLHDRIEQAA